MTIRIIILFFIFINQILTVDGQDSNQGKWSVGVTGSADYCSYTLLEENLSPIISDMYDYIKDYKIGYSGGFLISREIKPCLTLVTGLKYTNRGHDTKKSFLVFGDVIDPRYGFVYIVQKAQYLDITTSDTKFTFHCVDIPVKAIVKFGKKKIKFITSGGFTGTYIFKATETYTKKGTEKTDKAKWDYNHFNISPTAGIGIEYTLNSKYSLQAEPEFRYSLLETSDNDVTTKLWWAGINFTCNYRF